MHQLVCVCGDPGSSHQHQLISDPLIHHLTIETRLSEAAPGWSIQEVIQICRKSQTSIGIYCMYLISGRILDDWYFNTLIFCHKCAYLPQYIILIATRCSSGLRRRVRFLRPLRPLDPFEQRMVAFMDINGQTCCPYGCPCYWWLSFGHYPWGIQK
jgi:hypothetical protein